MRHLTQSQTVALLKVYIDICLERGPDTSTGRNARRQLMELMSKGDVATGHVLHNIGAKRRAWLMEFLNGTPRT